jgi:alkylhydroperoxidase/carboxymuconolactone decarboxylase family protein YurZ
VRHQRRGAATRGLRRHIDGARRAGASDAEIVHAILAVVPIAGAIAYAGAETVLQD